MVDIHTIEGDDDINKAFGAVMETTVYTMYREGLITVEEANEFNDTHMAQLAKRSVFERVINVLGGKWSTKVVISKVFRPEETEEEE